jgi:hypothetical protein
MDTPSRDESSREGVIDRRRLLWLAAGVGLAATVSACASRPDPLPTESPRATAAPDTPLPAPATVAAPTSVASGTSAVMLCRESWGALPAHPGGRPHTITRMTIHHTEVVLGDNANSPARLRGHQHYHQDSKGWIDIAYHVGVDRNGNIYELRSTDLAGDTATKYDTTGHFLVVCEGDFNKETVSEEQLTGAATAFAWAAQRFAVSAETLAGHRDSAPETSCPGASLYQHVASGDLRRRVEDLLALGPVDLQNICGPDASARVAAIEAGR